MKWYPAADSKEGKLMEEGKYSARIVAEVSTNKREFIITSEIKFKYQYDAQQQKGIISLD